MKGISITQKVLLDSAVVGVFGMSFISLSVAIAEYLLLFRPCSDHRDTVRNKKGKAWHSEPPSQ